MLDQAGRTGAKLLRLELADAARGAQRFRAAETAIPAFTLTGLSVDHRRPGPPAFHRPSRLPIMRPSPLSAAVRVGLLTAVVLALAACGQKGGPGQGGMPPAPSPS